MMAAVHWTTEQPGTECPGDSWWQGLIDAGCLSLERQRVVLYVARQARSAMVLATARAFAAFLQRVSGLTVEVLDPAGSADWPNVRLTLDPADRLRVDAVCLRGGAMVPRLWLDDFTLVTITGVAADTRWGIAGVLTAQAELLTAAGDDLGVAFEAHRLLAADLTVACGTQTAGSTASRSWWAASTDDVGVERAIAIAAGAQPASLPLLRYFSRHETPLASQASAGEPPVLQGYVAPESKVRAARARARVAQTARVVRDDVRLAAANLHRIPHFIGRRWPRLLQLGRRTA